MARALERAPLVVSEDSDCEEGVSREPVETSIAKYRNTHRTFLYSVQLALSVAVWVTIFSIPVLSERVNVAVFGEYSGDNVCGPYDTGFMVEVAAPGEPKQLARMAETNVTSCEDGKNGCIWCGYLFRSYDSMWPNVVQMIIFTVYQNTGTTIMQAWQGIIGTTCATVNWSIMTAIYPNGAHQHECTPAEQTAGKCAQGEMVNDGPYSAAVAWLDTLLVLFLFLISKAKKNTIMFGMNWHCYLMMDFMNPALKPDTGGEGHFALDSYGSAVGLTTLVGALLAVVVTLVPSPLCNYTLLDETTEAVVAGVGSIYADCIDYICGDRQTGKRFQIAEKVQAFETTTRGISNNLRNSWWETLDIGKWGQARILYKSFDSAIASLSDVAYFAKTSIIQEDFGGKHLQFCQPLRGSMTSLKDHTAALMETCATCLADGDIGEEDRETLQAGIEDVKLQQAKLVHAYSQVAASDKASHPFVSEDLSQEYMFLFSLSAWAKKMTDFASTVDDIADMNRSSCIHTAITTVTEGFKETWNTSAMFDVKHVSFAIRSFVALSVSFLMGKFLKGSVFPGNSATMAATLCLLINEFPTSAMHKNMHRLLGVTLGKVLPILFMGILACFCQYEAYAYLHAATLFVYMFMFNYVYYASAQWSSEGCLIASFGCYGMMTRCSVDASKSFSSNYAELGMIVASIWVQTMVDLAIRYPPPTPSALAVQKIEEIDEALTRGWTAFFDGEGLQVMTQAAEDMKAAIEAAFALVPEVDPGMQVVPCGTTPFKVDLYKGALTSLRLVVTDFSVLLMAVKEWVPLAAPVSADHKDADAPDEGGGDLNDSRLLAALHSKPAMAMIRSDFMETLKTTMTALRDVLRHNVEAPVDSEHVGRLCAMSGMDRLEGMSDLCEQINRDANELVNHQTPQEVSSDLRVRTTVAVKALQFATEHLAQIDESSLTADIY